MRNKIDILEPISNRSGTIYYAGFVNGSYTSFLGYKVLTKKELKNKLKEKYYNLLLGKELNRRVLEFYKEEYYGRGTNEREIY